MLRPLAVTLDGKTAQLQMMSIILIKQSLESQESMGFVKATKILTKKNSMDIMKIKEVFQKYGYTPLAKKNSKSPHSPQLFYFGLERYIVSQVLPNPPQAVNNEKAEPKILTPFSKQSLVNTSKCALKMGDFELVSLNTLCHTDSPLAPTFCTPGVKVLSAKSSTALIATNYPSAKANNECFENFADPSSTISSYENLLKTPTPPEVTTIPEDILSLVAVRAVPPSKVFLPLMEDRRCKMPVTKKTGEEMIVDPSSRYGN
ncbi:hypothetical protein ABFV05_014718 [Capra hircus]